jgi:hypothetical protein
VRETPLPADDPIVAEGKIEPSRFFLGPDEGVSAPFVGPNLTEQGVARIKTGATRLYMVGSVTYTDVFGKSRETRFCAQHEVDTDLWARCQHNNWIR